MSELARQRNGRNNSRNSSKPLATLEKRRTTTGDVERSLLKAFNYWQIIGDPALRREYSREFLFHLSDCQADVKKMAELCQHPENYSKKQSADIVFGFFVHAVPHLSAARRILFSDMSDPFVELYQPTTPRKKKVTRTNNGAT